MCWKPLLELLSAPASNWFSGCILPEVLRASLPVCYPSPASLLWLLIKFCSENIQNCERLSFESLTVNPSTLREINRKF